MLQKISVKGKIAIIPDWLPSKGWSIHPKGYLLYTSRKKNPIIPRNTFAHRAVMEKLLGRKLLTSEQVCHQNFDKLNNCPFNLMVGLACFNPSNSKCDPYTGRRISFAEYQRRYQKVESVVDW